MRARDFFVRGNAEMARWDATRKQRLKEAPPQLSDVHAEASRAAAHLSWKRVSDPLVGPPSQEVTQFILTLWGDFVAALPKRYKTLFLREWDRLHGRGASEGPQEDVDALGGGRC